MPGHETTVPGEQGLRGDEERRPAPAGQQPGGRRKKGPIGRPQVRPVYLPAQHGQLMAKDDNLELLVFGGASAQGDQFDQLSNHEVKERDQQR
jgi:hypothetical protein